MVSFSRRGTAHCRDLRSIKPSQRDAQSPVLGTGPRRGTVARRAAWLEVLTFGELVVWQPRHRHHTVSPRRPRLFAGCGMGFYWSGSRPCWPSLWIRAFKADRSRCKNKGRTLPGYAALSAVVVPGHGYRVEALSRSASCPCSTIPDPGTSCLPPSN
jgi:hypothetical protein